VNLHAKSRLTLEPLRALRSETKGQATARPGRARTIPRHEQEYDVTARHLAIDSNPVERASGYEHRPTNPEPSEPQRNSAHS